VIVAHSLGLHLIPAELLQQADAMVLLASFGRFVPDGPEGRRLQVALRGMASELASEGAETRLHQFLVRAAAPQPFSQLPPTILEAPLNAGGRQRLQEDLDLLAATSGLPRGFPAQARCLIVEAERDAIVEPRARQDLREALPAADRLLLTGLGHALLATPWIAQVFQWIEQL
jgi:pimeloyl-[acyl-carrier protein] methyl ester esterase